MTTAWRTIPCFSNYEVSEYGQVRRSVHTNPRSRGWSKKRPGDLLSPAKKKYPFYHLMGDDGRLHSKFVHTLVAVAFHGPRPQGMNALHRDDDKWNNHYQNIYWGTQSQNIADSNRNGNWLRGIKHPNCTIPDDTVRTIRELYATGNFSQQQIADRFQITQSTVSSFIRRKKRDDVI